MPRHIDHDVAAEVLIGIGDEVGVRVTSRTVTGRPSRTGRNGAPLTSMRASRTAAS